MNDEKSQSSTSFDLICLIQIGAVLGFPLSAVPSGSGVVPRNTSDHAPAPMAAIKGKC